MVAPASQPVCYISSLTLPFRKLPMYLVPSNSWGLNKYEPNEWIALEFSGFSMSANLNS